MLFQKNPNFGVVEHRTPRLKELAYLLTEQPQRQPKVAARPRDRLDPRRGLSLAQQHPGFVDDQHARLRLGSSTVP